MALSLNKKLIAVAACGALVLTGCSNKEEASNTPSTTAASAKPTTSVNSMAKATLSDWEGSYRSLASYLDDPEYFGEFEKGFKDRGVDAQATVSKLKTRYGVPFEGLVVQEDSLTFVKDRKNLNHPVEQAVKYSFEESYKETYNGHDLTWFVFKADQPADNTYIFLMKKHGEEELEHFHARFGNDKAAMKKSDTFPTFVEPKKAPKEQVVDELMEHAH